MTIQNQKSTIIVTLPPPHLRQSAMVARHSMIDGARFNVGARVKGNQKAVLKEIISVLGTKDFHLDLKGRQLRIISSAEQYYGTIFLNHYITITGEVHVFFRGDDQMYEIVEAVDNKILIDPTSRFMLGAGQALNIIGEYEVVGYLTAEDKAYIEAAKELGLHNYMLSYVEKESDIEELMALDPQARIVAKIESEAGLQFVRDVYPHKWQNVRLMAARDDLLINIKDKKRMIAALQLIIEKDPTAILASHVAISLQNSQSVSMGDISDLYLMYKYLGYRHYMLCDNLCYDYEAFHRAIVFLRAFLDDMEKEEKG